MKRNNKFISSALAAIMSMSVFMPTVQAYEVGEETSNTGKIEETKPLESPFTTTRVFGKGFGENAEVLATGGRVEIELFASKVINPEKIGVELKSNGQLITLGKNDFSVTGDLTKKKRTISINIPKNETNEEKEYEVRFTDDKDNENPTYYDNVKVGIVQKATEKEAAELKKEIVINSFDSRIPELPSNGGTTSITARGENLDSDRLSLKITKDGKDVTNEIIKSNNQFMGTENTMSTSLNFPKQSSEKDEKYTITLVVDGAEKNITNVVVSKYGTNQDDTELSFKSVYLSLIHI